MSFQPNTVSTFIFLFFLFSAIMTVLCMVFFLMALRKDDVSIESHWGGLGGGLSGWHFSRPFVFLVLTIALALVTGLLAGGKFINAADRLKEKYAPIVRILDQEHGQLDHYYVQDRKLVIKATVADATAPDRIMNLINLINPSKDDIQAEITVKPAKPPGTK